MDRNDQQAIESLFSRLAEVERQSAPRDPEAEALIRSLIARHSSAPYYMAQTIVVQQQALETAQRRIEELENRGSGFLSGIFGDGGRQSTRRGREAEDSQPWANRRGGGFLAGAAQTAVGVAGGVLLGNMLAGALLGGSGEAQAAEADADNDASDSNAGDSGDFDGGSFDGGDF